MEGYLKLYRKIQDHWLWQDRPFSRGQAWIDLLLMANHRETRFLLGSEVVTAAAGDVVTSEQKLMKRWGWSKSKVRTFLKLLEGDGMLLIKADAKKTTLSLCNYRDYNVPPTAAGPDPDRPGTARRPAADTIKNEENHENEDHSENSHSAPAPGALRSCPGKKRAPFVPPTEDEVARYCRERQSPVDPRAFVDFYESKGWVVGRAAMRDWRASVRSWEHGMSRAGPAAAADPSPQDGPADIERLKRLIAEMDAMD